MARPAPSAAMACPVPLVPATPCAKAFDENSVTSARVAKGRYFFDIVRISLSLYFSGGKSLRGRYGRDGFSSFPAGPPVFRQTPVESVGTLGLVLRGQADVHAGEQ